MTTTTIALRNWAPMFDDARDNLHGLPAELLSAHQAVERLDAEVAVTRPDRPDLAAVEREVTDGYLTAARNGEAWPDVAVIREARTAVADHDLRDQVLERAQTEASAELLGLIHDHADAIITDYLRPVFGRLVAALEVAASVLPESPSVDALMRAPDKVRKAWLALDDDVSKHARITSTALRLNRLNPPVHDVEGEFASLTNVRDIWTGYGVGRTRRGSTLTPAWSGWPSSGPAARCGCPRPQSATPPGWPSTVNVSSRSSATVLRLKVSERLEADP